MLDANLLDSIAKHLHDAIPPSLRNIEHGLQQKFKDVLQAAFAKLDLVTREEFDTQVKVLSRTRAKVTELEQQMEALLKQQDK